MIETTDRTSDVLAEMFRENTGRALLDSGDYYGRNWERNQTRNLEAEPAATLDCSFGEVGISVSAYHFLCERLTYDPVEDGKFQRWADSPINEHKSWLEIMEAWAESKGTADADWNGTTVNTYNHDNCLDQTLQYTLYTNRYTSTGYVLLQVHGGCDVRGGYTRPRVFMCDPYEILGDSRCGLYCNACNAYWDFESGDYSEYDNAGTVEVESTEPVLPGMPTARWLDVPAIKECEIYDAENCEPGELPKPGYRVIVWRDGRASCPCCGSGYLVATGP